MNDHVILATLNTLYLLHGAGVPTDAGVVGRRIGQSPSAVGAALVHLEARGLVEARTCRLTMAGLAAAVALAADAATRTQPRAA